MYNLQNGYVPTSLKTGECTTSLVISKTSACTTQPLKLAQGVPTCTKSYTIMYLYIVLHHLQDRCYRLCIVLDPVSSSIRFCAADRASEPKPWTSRDLLLLTSLLQRHMTLMPSKSADLITSFVEGNVSGLSSHDSSSGSATSSR